MGNRNITMQGDRFRIEQVLINLLSNASKYSPEGSRIEILVEPAVNHVKLQVKDQGIGIDAEKLPHVFKKFTRADNAQPIAGYGLGLYISDKIVRKHGDSMGVESEKEKGSVFWFTLPY